MLSHLLNALVEYRCREFVAIFLLEEVALFLMFYMRPSSKVGPAMPTGPVPPGLSNQSARKVLSNCLVNINLQLFH